MALLSRDQILGRDDLPHEDVPVPEWGGTVRIRCLTAKRAAEWSDANADLVTSAASVEAMAALVCLSAIDDKGEPLFTEADLEALGQRHPKALRRVFDAALKLNAITDDDIEGN